MIIGDEDILQNMSQSAGRTGVRIVASMGSKATIHSFRAAWASVKQMNSNGGEVDDIARLRQATDDPTIIKEITPETVEPIRAELNRYEVKFAIQAPAPDGKCYIGFQTKDSSTLEHAMKQVEAKHSMILGSHHSEAIEPWQLPTGQAPTARDQQAPTSSLKSPKREIKGKAGLGNEIEARAKQRSSALQGAGKPKRIKSRTNPIK